MKFPKVSTKALRQSERRFNTPLSAEQYERDAEISFREARRTGSAVYEAHGRIAKLHAERVRRGLATVDALPTGVLQRWGWDDATAALRAHASN